MLNSQQRLALRKIASAMHANAALPQMMQNTKTMQNAMMMDNKGMSNDQKMNALAMSNAGGGKAPTAGQVIGSSWAKFKTGLKDTFNPKAWVANALTGGQYTAQRKLDAQNQYYAQQNQQNQPQQQ